MKRNLTSKRRKSVTPRKPSRLELLAQSTAVSLIHLSTHEVERRRALEQARRDSVSAEVHRLEAELKHGKLLLSELDAVIVGMDLAANR